MENPLWREPAADGMVVGRAFVLAFVLVALPAASADPLDEANAPLCSTVWSYFCVHPVGVPESPEEAEESVEDAVAPFQDAVNGPLCSTVWSYFCTHPVGVPASPDEGIAAGRDAVQPFFDAANAPLCSTVWSYFCANPLGLPV
jgi:hypothetical protein